MAKAKETVNKAVATKVAKSKEVADSDALSDDEIAQLALGAKERENNSRSSGGMLQTFVSISQDGASALKKKDKAYIEDLEPRMFYVGNKKIILGEEVKAVPLMIVEVYNEMTNEKKPRFLGVWQKDDAERYDLVAGDYFRRELPNGNILHPCTWVLAYLPDFPELERVVFSFKSTARKIANAWRKDIDARGGNPASLEYTLSIEDTSNASGDWYQILPEFSREIFKIEDGKFSSKIKYARDVILLQDAYTKAYVAGNIVRKRSAGAQAAIESDDGLEGSDEHEF